MLVLRPGTGVGGGAAWEAEVVVVLCAAGAVRASLVPATKIIAASWRYCRHSMDPSGVTSASGRMQVANPIDHRAEGGSAGLRFIFKLFGWEGLLMHHARRGLHQVLKGVCHRTTGVTLFLSIHRRPSVHLLHPFALFLHPFTHIVWPFVLLGGLSFRCAG